MVPISVGLSDSKSSAASTGSGSYSIGGNTYESNPVLWIVGAAVLLVGFIAYLKFR